MFTFYYIGFIIIKNTKYINEVSMIIEEKVKKYIPIKDLSNLYVVADFDRTITNGSSKTSWSILSESPLVPKEYKKERQVFYDYYRPIEIDESLDYEYKSSKMKEWYEKHISLFVKYKITEEIFKNAATDLRIMEFRPGAKEFIKFLYDNSIPLIIISAGIGNFIETFLHLNNCYYNNIYVSSNKIIFKNGIAVGVDKNIIHSLNKNEVSLPDNIKNKLANRKNVLLLGDQISDLRMVDKDKHDIVYTNCFLCEENKKELNNIRKEFDIVCEIGDNYFDLKNILFN